jgi:hypothetical protein
LINSLITLLEFEQQDGLAVGKAIANSVPILIAGRCSAQQSQLDS